MRTESARVEELGEKYGSRIALHKLWLDADMWRLWYLRHIFEIRFYEEMAIYAEEGMVVYPDGTYWNAELSDFGREVMEWWLRVGIRRQISQGRLSEISEQYTLRKNGEK